MTQHERAAGQSHAAVAHRPLKTGLLGSGSALAAALVLLFAGHPAAAQVDPNFAGQGVPTIAPADGSVTRSPSNDAFTINNTNVVVDWTTFDSATSSTPIQFLPSGKSLSYSGSTGFTVLNRIVPSDATRAIRLDGTVNSTVVSSTGGNIWFYSPGGVIAGAGSVFNVGGLLLTSNAIDVTGGLFGPNGEIRFRGPAGAGSTVEIEDGATISLQNNGSYFAAVAPRVVQAGTVDVNGSIAYVAAEQADLTINQGLFDISVSVGTTDPNGVVHTGVTTGPARAPNIGEGFFEPDDQQIYMVAVPKNDAITLLVSGSLGYVPAVNASQADGIIVLSAGKNVSGTTIGNSASSISGTIQFGDIDLSNDLIASATDSIAMVSQRLDTDTLYQVDAIGNISLSAGNSIDFGSGEEGRIAVAGNVQLQAGTNGQGGTINIFAAPDPQAGQPSASVVINGNFTASADGVGAINVLAPGLGENATGGAVDFSVSDGGYFEVDGLTTLTANATAGAGAAGIGTATGGTIDFAISGAFSQIAFVDAVLSASATDPSTNNQIQIPGNGNASTGGTITANFSGGQFSAGDVAMNADAESITGDNSATAQGGSVILNFTGGTQDFGFLGAAASASSDDGGARAGLVSMLVDAGQLTFSNSLYLSAEATGDTLASTSPVVSLVVQNGSTLTLQQEIQLLASGTGGTGASTVRSGDIAMTIDSSSVTTSSLYIESFAGAGAFNNNTGADAVSGSIDLVVRNGGVLDLGYGSFRAAAGGSDGASGSLGQGGDINILIDNGSLGGSADPALFIDASGTGGTRTDSQGDLGVGIGGTVDLTLQGASGSLTFDDLFVNADGQVFFDVEGGGSPSAGDGGNGLGGAVNFNLLGGTISAGRINIGAGGYGGEGGDGDLTDNGLPIGVVGMGGAGTGGSATFILDGSNGSIGRLDLDAQGQGGRGGSGDSVTGQIAQPGGTGTGGIATFQAVSGSVVFGDIDISAPGQGGSGRYGDSAAAGDGGNGVGGTAQYFNDGLANVTADTVLVTATGLGGDGGNADNAIDTGSGGNGFGGISFFQDSSGVLDFGTLTVGADGTGGEGGEEFGYGVGSGQGGNGGNGTGGDARVLLEQDSGSGLSYSVTAIGLGGIGGYAGSGGDGGSAAGGVAQLIVSGVDISLGTPTIDASATGGTGSTSAQPGGAGGSGGNAVGGTARLLSQDGAYLTIDSLSMNVGAVGGTGASGSFNGGGPGGAGGNGGDGQGGVLEIAARDGGTLIINTTFFSASGQGGRGGDGGDVSSFNTFAAGAGGNGGIGQGGEVQFIAAGGFLQSDGFFAQADGFGASAGLAGEDGYGTLGVQGVGGDAIGGIVAITLDQDDGGNPGGIDFGDVALEAHGYNAFDDSSPTGAAGRIEINDFAGDANGGMTFNSLNAETLSFSSDPNSGFFLTSTDGPVRVFGDTNILSGGNVSFLVEGTGGFAGDGDLDIFAFNEVSVALPTNNLNNTFLSLEAGDVPSVIAQNVTIFAGGSVFSDFGTRIEALDTLDITAGGFIFAADLKSVNLLSLSAGANVVLYDALVDGPVQSDFLGNATTGLIRVASGEVVDPQTGFSTYDPFDVQIFGNVVATGGIDVLAGGNVRIENSATLSADNHINLTSGDDIIVAGGALLEAALDPVPDFGYGSSDPLSDPSNLTIFAGGLTLNSPLAAGNISSAIIEGSLYSANAAVVIRADAVQALIGSIDTPSLFVDVFDAPGDGITPSDDGGQLVADCVEGNICLASVSAFDTVQIGQQGAPNQLIIADGDINAIDVAITTRRDLILGSFEADTRYNGSNSVYLQSLEGNIELRGGAALSSTTLQLFADSGSLLGTGNLSSAGDVGISVADSIYAGSIVAGSRLMRAEDINSDASGNIILPGSFVVSLLSLGFGDANIDVGRDVLLGTVILSDADIQLTAGGDAQLLATDGVSAIGIDATNITIGAIDAGSAIDLNALGGISGGSASAGGDISASASDVSVDAFDAGGQLSISASSVSLGNGSSGDDTTIDADSINFGSLFAGGSMSLTAGDISGGDLEAGNRVDVMSSGDVTLDTLTAGGNVNLTSDTGFINSGDISTDAISLSGGDLTIEANGQVTLGTVEGAGVIDVDSGGIDFGGLSASENIRLVINSDIFGDFLDAGEDIFIANFGDATIGDISAGDEVTMRIRGDLLVDTLTAGSNVSLSIDGSLEILTDTQVGGLISASASAVLINSQGGMTFSTLYAQDGDLEVNGGGGTVRADDVQSAGDIRITNQGNIILGAVESGVGGFSDSLSSTPFQTLAGGLQIPQSGVATPLQLISVGSPGPGDITIDATGDVTLQNDLSAAESLFISSGGLLDIQAIATGRFIDVSSADIDIGTTGQLGDNGFTQSIAFAVASDAPMVIGGTGSSGNYSLSNDEFSRVRSDGSINFFAPIAQVGPYSLIIDNLVATAGPAGTSIRNIGQNGSLQFSSEGDIRIIGDVSLRNVTSNTVLEIDAGGAILLDSANGSIALADPDGFAGGALRLVGSDIFAVTDSKLAGLAGLSVAQIDTLLADNGGVTDGRALFSANDLQFNVSGDLLIQNTAVGTDFDSRRGFASRFLTITTGGSASRIVINGVLLDQSGAIATTGIDVIGQAAINGNSTGTAYATGSTINGCLIADPASCSSTPAPTPTPEPSFPNINVTQRDVIEEEVDEEEQDGRESEENQAEGFFLVPLIELRKFEQFGYEPLIDEPVTGAGNEDLWMPSTNSTGDGGPDSE